LLILRECADWRDKSRTKLTTVTISNFVGATTTTMGPETILRPAMALMNSKNRIKIVNHLARHNVMPLRLWSRNLPSATIDFIMFGCDWCILDDVEQFSSLLPSNESGLDHLSFVFLY
jgi:hypothetical protein